MKRLNLLMLFCSLFVTVSLMESCVEDPCDDVNCGAGTCFEGTCNCDTGYEVDANGSCTVLSRDKFIGSFDLDEICDSGSDVYTTGIIASSADNLTIVFTNLYNAGVLVDAVVGTDGTSFTIEEQTFGTGTISGSGSIDKDTGVISVTYTVDVGGTGDTCTATLTPQ